MVFVPVEQAASNRLRPASCTRARRAGGQRGRKRLLAACSTGTNTIPRGGHFAAFEQPGLFVTELRNWFRALR